MGSIRMQTADLYLGAFLILCGFSLSLLNLRRVLKKNKFSTVLLSENILLMCIGIAFMIRAVNEAGLVNVYMYEMAGRTSNIVAMTNEGQTKQCTIWSFILGYGPLIVSMVNSFLSLIIDNYLHYTMLNDTMKRDHENVVQDFNQRSISDSGARFQIRKIFTFFKRYFYYIAIALQWIIPILMGVMVYPMGVKEMMVERRDFQGDTCLAMIQLSNTTCNTRDNNQNYELRKYIKPSVNYLEVYEDTINGNKSEDISTVVDNVNKIITSIQNNSFMDLNITSSTLHRQPKSEEKCMKVCFVENKNLILYMFVLAVVSYFIPITISTIILTKIHIMDTNKPNTKTYVTRELLYNILFWTPVMFDTILSLILCSYAMNGMKTSLFNIVANVYQAVKNFMNTKYFKDNSIIPV